MLLTDLSSEFKTGFSVNLNLDLIIEYPSTTETVMGNYFKVVKLLQF